MIPEPDYSESSEEASSAEESDSETETAVERLRDLEEEDEKEEEVKKRKAPLASFDEDILQASSSSVRSPKISSSADDVFIKPKKPTNPYLESSERLKLHKELKFSQKYGKTGTNPKSELQRALEKYAENKLKRDLASSKQTSLEKILEMQARKIEMQESVSDRSTKCPSWIDKLHQQQNLPWTDPKTDEFYRVHARVVSNLMENLGITEDGGDRSSAHRSPKPRLSTSSKESKTSESSDLDSSD